MSRNTFERLPKCNADLFEALYAAFLMARRGKTNTDDEHKFEVNWYENLEQLCADIINRTYKPSRSKAFITHNPVDREIFAAPFRDRIVHHLLYAIVAPWWDKRFIYESASCREGKGTDFAVARLQRAMRKVSRNGTVRAYVIKCDISGYFMSLQRDLLYQKVMRGLAKQFPDKGWIYDLCSFLWHEIIFDDPVLGVRLASPRKEWETLPPNKSLFNQPEGQGIVIGNLTSQLLSNIFLNDFDWFMKKTLGFEYYGRYVDDFYVVVTEADYKRAKRLFRHEVPEYLQTIGLKLHPNKRYAQEVHKGCPYLGKKVHLNALLPGKRYKSNFIKAADKFLMTGGEGISRTKYGRESAGGVGDLNALISYIGMSTHMTARKFLVRVFDERGWRSNF